MVGLFVFVAAFGAAGSADRGVSDGLTHWFAAEGDAMDSAGSAHGTTVGAVGYTPGAVGMAFDFSNGGEVSIPSPAGAFGTSDFSLAFWVRGVPAVGQVQIMSKREFCACHQFWDIRSSGSLGMEMYEVCPSTNANISVGGVTVLDNAWHHIVLLRQGASRRGYVDGALREIRNTGAIAVVSVAAPMRLNGGPCVSSDGTMTFNGALDEIRLYDRAITIDEVRELAGRCRGDVDGDGDIDFGDLNATIGSFNLALGEDSYNAAADFDGDGDVDFADLNVVLSLFNTDC